MYIVSGQTDAAVDPTLQEAQRDYFNNYGANVDYHSLDIGHVIEWNGFGDALSFIWNQWGAGSVTIGAEDNSDWQTNGKIYHFDQSEFTDAGMGETAANLADYGIMYVPDHCTTNAGCKVVLGLHGCGMDAGYYMSNDSGYVQVAGWNNVILIMPISRTDCFSVDVNEHGDANYNNYAGK